MRLWKDAPGTTYRDSTKPAATDGGSAAASSPQLALAAVGADELAVTQATTPVVPSASRVASAGNPAASLSAEMSPQTLALIIATTMGLHNFSKGWQLVNQRP